jgi:dihydroorotase
MAFDTIIRGGRIASSQGIHLGDVAVSGGKIVAIGDLAGSSAAEDIDAKGLVLMPGVIDTQVHFREPGMEHKEDLESGTRAAIVGGVTTIFEMPNTSPPTTSQEALEDKLRRASGRAWCDYGFFVGASPENAVRLAEYELLPGSPGIKIFMGSSTGSLLVESEEGLRQVLSHGNHRVSVHSEDEARLRDRKSLISASPHPREHPFLRDAEAAVLSTTRLLKASAETGRPVHVLHISTGDEIPLLKEGKRGSGGRVSCEVTPQHLYFRGPEVYEKLGTLAQMNPPLRDAAHNDALWSALLDGVFDVFGSDHAPHTLEEKSQPYPRSPSGMPGVQTLLSVLLTFVSQGRIGLEQVVRMACETPAQLFGIRDKGLIAPGFDADLVLVDLDATRIFERSMVQSKCGWSPFEGEKLTGWPVRTILRGKTVVIEGELLGAPTGQPAHYKWKE